MDGYSFIKIMTDKFRRKIEMYGEGRFDIPYIKLKFHIVFPKDAVLPREKVSALRGGMGEMILRQNCIADRNCGHCAFKEACMVHTMVYTRMKRKPAFMQGDDSVGYLLECENHQTEFSSGQGLFFYLVLFGNNIVYFGQYLQAFYQLGINGLGKYHARFQITEVRNGRGQKIVDGYTVNMKNYYLENVNDYVTKRIHVLQNQGCENKVIFHTPLCLKFRGEYLERFCSEAIFKATLRRVMMLDYFVENYMDQPEFCGYPDIICQETVHRVVPRYSSTHGSKVLLKGIVGTAYLDKIPQGILPYLAAGELLHIGKNISFGFGRYSIC